MDDMSEKINSILSDPQAMNMIRSLASSLDLQGNGQQNQRQQDENTFSQSANNGNGGIDISQISQMLGMMNNNGGQPNGNASEKGKNADSSQSFEQGAAGDGVMKALLKVMPLLNQLKYDDDRIKLLHALRPLLSEERRQRVDWAENLIRLMSILPQIGMI